MKTCPALEPLPSSGKDMSTSRSCPPTALNCSTATIRRVRLQISVNGTETKPTLQDCKEHSSKIDLRVRCFVRRRGASKLPQIRKHVAEVQQSKSSNYRAGKTDAMKGQNTQPTDKHGHTNINAEVTQPHAARACKHQVILIGNFNPRITLQIHTQKDA